MGPSRCDSLFIPEFLMRRLLAIALLLLASAQIAAAPDSPAVTAGEILDHIKVLASDEFAGREAGTPGGDAARDWIAARLKECGLVGAGKDGSFLQEVPIPSMKAAETCALLVKRADGWIHIFDVEMEFAPFGFSPEAEIEGPVVFAGYGITAKNLDWDDYAGLDVKGRIVLLFRHEPHEGTPKARPFRQAGHSSFDRKIRNAHAHGAIGVIVVNDPLHHEKDELVGMVRGRRVKVPALFAKRGVAVKILDDADLAAIQRDLDAGKSPATLARPETTVRMTVALDRTPLKAHNVVGLLAGSDPKLRDEYIVVGAHYDHLGQGSFGSLAGPGKIHNGADDNASGTAAVIEVAESLAKEGARPARSVIFILFTGEEKGLLGSLRYCRKPLRPLKQTVAMLNLDMVGRSKGSSLYIGGVGTSPGFQAILEPLVATEKLTARYGYGGAAPSDNMPFFRAGIPTLFFFTGMHPDYHRPTDDWQKINANGAAGIARVAAGAVRSIAGAPKRPDFHRAGRAYVGVRPGRGGSGALVQKVMPGTPAQKAGLRDGDRIVAAGGKPINSWRDLQGLLGKARPGDELAIEVIREGERQEMKLVLGER
jgi:Peptidase family M28/PDZ domain/PA domain